ncbi:MAG TPA: TetR/AcrR family transcriptional regulator, partial [Streptosporangiaceae bacterium]
LVSVFGLTDGPLLRRSLLIAVELGDALVKLAFRCDPDGDPQVLAEARAIVGAYLTRKLG